MNETKPTHIYDKVVSFLVPEKQISLKLFFDNIRNYGIIALIYLLSLWLKKQSLVAPAGVISAFGLNGSNFAVVPRIVAMILLVLNLSQSLLLVSGILRPIFYLSRLLEQHASTDIGMLGVIPRIIFQALALAVIVGFSVVLANFVMAVLLYAVVSGLK